MAKNENTKYIVYGVIGLTVIGIAYFGILKPITNALGLTNDAEDREADRAIDKLSTQQVFSPLTYEQNKGRVTISNQKANQIASKIWNGKGYMIDNEDQAVGAIKSALTLCNISYVAYIFERNYHRDLHDFLKSYLESSNWVTLENAISKMNKF